MNLHQSKLLLKQETQDATVLYVKDIANSLGRAVEVHLHIYAQCVIVREKRNYIICSNAKVP